MASECAANLVESANRDRYSAQTSVTVMLAKQRGFVSALQHQVTSYVATRSGRCRWSVYSVWCPCEYQQTYLQVRS
jgi:hypothetical protein